MATAPKNGAHAPTHDALAEIAQLLTRQQAQTAALLAALTGGQAPAPKAPAAPAARAVPAPADEFAPLPARKPTDPFALARAAYLARAVARLLAAAPDGAFVGDAHTLRAALRSHREPNDQHFVFDKATALGRAMPSAVAELRDRGITTRVARRRGRGGIAHVYELCLTQAETTRTSHEPGAARNGAVGEDDDKADAFLAAWHAQYGAAMVTLDDLLSVAQAVGFRHKKLAGLSPTGKTKSLSNAVCAIATSPRDGLTIEYHRDSGNTRFRLVSSRGSASTAETPPPTTALPDPTPEAVAAEAAAFVAAWHRALGTAPATASDLVAVADAGSYFRGLLGAPDERAPRRRASTLGRVLGLIASGVGAPLPFGLTVRDARGHKRSYALDTPAAARHRDRAADAATPPRSVKNTSAARRVHQDQLAALADAEADHAELVAEAWRERHGSDPIILDELVALCRAQGLYPKALATGGPIHGRVAAERICEHMAQPPTSRRFRLASRKHAGVRMLTLSPVEAPAAGARETPTNGTASASGASS